MSLDALLDSKSIIETKKQVVLDYSKLDPNHVKKEEQKNKELSAIFQKAQKEAAKIISDARGKARNILAESKEKSQNIQKMAENKSAKLIEDAEIDYQKIIDSEKVAMENEREHIRKEKEEAQQQLEDYRIQVKEEVTTEVWKEIREDVERKITQEYSRLIDQVHAILNAAINQRRKVLNETENDISELVILIARKVVKVLSHNDNNVVIQNIVQALAKLKGREKFLIRVNSTHLEELKSFIPQIKDQLEIEGVISMVEDTRVDVGGCIIETEFGEIDARISTQLAEIEKRIRDAELVKNVSF